jgi:methylisocitrate lyase
MVNKIKTAVKSRKDKNFLIIARTDANIVEGINKTINRIKAYEDAGADIIFPEAMKDEEEFEKIRKNSKTFLLANMTEFGKTKILSTGELQSLGYNIVIYPVTTQRLAMKNVEDGLRTIMKDGHQNNIIDKMQTRKRLYELVEYDKYNKLDKKITDFNTDRHD